MERRWILPRLRLPIRPRLTRMPRSPMMVSAHTILRACCVWSFPAHMSALFLVVCAPAISLVIQALRTMIVDLSLDPTLFANKDTFYSVLTNTTLPLGATGNVIIDAQGNRLTGFLVTNYQSETGEFAAIGTLSGAGEFVPVSDTPAIVWMGGVTHPVDTPVRTILALSHSITYALRVVAGIIVALTLVIMGTIFFLRHMPVFKASSPLFLLSEKNNIMRWRLCSSSF